MQGKTRLSRRCAKTVQRSCKWRIKRKSHEESCDSSWDFGALEGTRIPGPLIKRAPRAEHSDFETFEFALFLCKASWFSARQFLHPLSYFASQSTHCIPWNRAKTVQKPCTYSGTNEKWWFLIHDLVAIWVTTKVNLIHGKKNAHSSEKFSGEWAFFCIMAFCIGHLPLLAWRLPFFEMKLTLLA